MRRGHLRWVNSLPRLRTINNRDLDSTNRLKLLDRKTQNELEEIIEAIRDKEASSSSEWKSAIEKVFRDHNFEMRKKVRVPDRGDGTYGFTAMVFFRGNLVVAVETGRCSVRMNSLPKINQLGPKVIRLIGLRHGNFNGSISGVDRVFSRFRWRS